MITKRLYVGGLSHSITKKDLKDRFGKFGEVSDVEVVTRKDEDGNPVKTFGYININITDAEFHRCMTVLNKSKWKGGTLQIELAKESFLHRLAVERQQAAESTKAKNISHKEGLVDSLKKAGIENFHMKAAVPGTEIPGHKDWVVSKFGRVLPVLHLKCESKSKVFKYDPSKHSHNIKKLNTDVTEWTPVSELTWEVPGGDDDISKKRRGEFPPLKKNSKKRKKDLSCSLDADHTEVQSNHKVNRLDMNNSVGGNTISYRGRQHMMPREPRSTMDSDDDDDDDDSLDDIRTFTTKEAPQMHEETEDNLEVVGDDFIVKSSVFQPGGSSNPLTSRHLDGDEDDDEDYDSADTDEILTRSKALKEPETELNKCPKLGLPGDMPSNKDEKTAGKKFSTIKTTHPTKKPASPSNENGEESDCSSESDSTTGSDSSVDSDYEAMMSNCCRLEISFGDLEFLAKQCSEAPGEEDEATSKPVAVKAPQKRGINPEDILASILGTDGSEDELEAKKPQRKKAKKKSTSSLPAFIGSKDLFGTSHASLEPEPEPKPGMKMQTGGRNRSEEQKSNTASTSRPDASELPTTVLPAEPPEHLVTNSECSNSPEPISDSLTFTLASSTEESSSSEKDERGEDVRATQSRCNHSASAKNMKDETNVPLDSSLKRDKNTIPGNALPSSEDLKACDGEKDIIPKNASRLQETTETLLSGDSSSEDDEQVKCASKPEAVSSKEQDEGPTPSRTAPVRHVVCDAEKQRQDNERRLAALEQRQRESAQQKKLIQGALAAVDTPNANKGKHIVFDSDDDSEAGDLEDSQPADSRGNDLSEESSKDTGRPVENSQSVNLKPKTSGAKLFDSSEEEEEEDSSDEDRFQIKPQFEGKAGQKLMELQSRFGADERFQMDSRFMESEEEEEDEESDKTGKTSHVIEEELVEEKKKNLEILQSLLNIKQPSHAESTKSKMFKDISALHYDPTRKDHAAFEKKKEPKTEGKATRRKKQAEAERLPEVSKEIFYDVAVDLKEVFGSATTAVEGEKDVAWDKKEEVEKEEEGKEEKGEESLTADNNTDMQSDSFSSTTPGKTQSSGFKFSFFGEDEEVAEDANAERGEYKIELLRGPKLTWQEDPRFQDSSSEEEYTEEDEGDNKTASVPAVQDLKPATKMLFFFYRDDERLKEGPSMFCRTAKLEDQRDKWEERRVSLIEEYRKKHKAARRNLKGSYHT